jgi:hypothetical protein
MSDNPKKIQLRLFLGNLIIFHHQTTLEVVVGGNQILEKMKR